MAGIYIHMSFCKQACHYCDFHFSTNLTSRDNLVDCLKKEIRLQRDYINSANQPINTIYFGGGTPSLLDKGQIEGLLQQIKEYYPVVNDAEITLEANPDDLTFDKLTELRNAGVNRLSIGVQSFDDHVLKFFNRSHNGAQSLQCIKNAREVGFNNLSIDLIYAIPNQSCDDWLKNIKRAIELDPEHISAYSLTIESQTAFGSWLKKGKLQPVSDDEAANDLVILIAELNNSGYEQYEVSNFSKPGYQSKHNSSYWKQESYLGIGPSAHSYNGISRQFNISHNLAYIRSIEKGSVPFELEILTPEEMANEYLLTTLRTSWGSDLNLLHTRFGYDLKNVHKKYLDNLVRENFATVEQGVLKLSAKGKLLADKISSDLFVDKLR